jgi:hypothetical protein
LSKNKKIILIDVNESIKKIKNYEWNDEIEARFEDAMRTVIKIRKERQIRE